MLRNRLRTLEQHVNSAELPDDVKVKLQGYISGCYGTLTSFNVLFAEEEDQFKGRRRRLTRCRVAQDLRRATKFPRRSFLRFAYEH